MTDPISDMLTRIRNAQKVRKSEVLVPHSNLMYTLAKVLQTEGYVAQVNKVTNNFPMINISLKYDNKTPAIQYIARVSKPGRRIYKKSHELPRVLSDMGIAIISTSQGIMSNKEARRRKLGGEVLCEIY